MNSITRSIQLYLILFISCVQIFRTTQESDDSAWSYKFSFTLNVNSQLSISCANTNDVVWIGWSHYGTRNNVNKRDERALHFPNEHDCWMNFTEKIAEQCNGEKQCDLSSQPTYIHKCGKISDYLYVSYKCIKDEKIFDICKPISRAFKLNSNGFDNFYLKSTDFPTEYPSSLDCSCSISSKTEQSLKMDVLWFSLQDNDYLNLFNKNLTGWINPTYEMPIMSKQTTVRLLTDDALAYKGFWLKVTNRKACRDDWQLVGDICVKVFSDALDWRSANTRCQQMNGYLIKIDDVTSDLKLTQYMKSFYPEISSYWIGLRKYVDQYSQERWMWSNNSTNYNDVSWWPWRKVNSTMLHHLSDKTVSPNNCVIKKRHEDGYFAVTCDSSMRNSFICQTETLNLLRDDSEIKLQCGTTESVQKHLTELAEFEKIGLASIKNYEVKSNKIAKPVETTNKPTTSFSNLFTKLSIFNEIKQNVDLEDDLIDEETTTRKQFLKQQQQNLEARLNTTVLAGMVCGIGFVIVLINLGILFICRRNLKNFLKNTKENHQQPREDMIQEYFDAFNTFHNLQKSKSTLPVYKTKLGGLSEQQAKTLTLLHQNQQQLSSGNSNSGDDSLLMHESAQLFYNPRDIQVRQASSAFKPFNRDEPQLNQQFLEQVMQQRQSFLPQTLTHNQYDKISHQAIQSIQKLKQNEINDSAGQYAHTYECLDTLEVPNRRNASLAPGFVNLSKTYRPNVNDSGVDTTMMMMMINSMQSPSNNLNDLNNVNNLSTSSASSTSGASSTQQLLKPTNQEFTVQQIITLNDLNQLNHLILNSNTNKTNNATVAALLNNKFEQTNCILDNGTWSPDSAYYSSIPTLTNYNSNQANTSSNLQQLNLNSFNTNNLNESFKSHLV